MELGKLVGGAVFGVLLSLASATAAPPARFVLPRLTTPSSPSTIEELVSDLNRRWGDLTTRQQQAVQETSLRQWSQLLPDRGHALEELTRTHQREQRELEQQLAATLDARQADLRAQQPALEEQLLAARNELARGQQAVRDLTGQTERTGRRIADIRTTLASRLQDDQANHQRWAAEIQSDIQEHGQRIATTTYVDEQQRRQREIDTLAAEQARLLDTSRRWQGLLIRFAAPDLHAADRELQQLTERLTAARTEETLLSRHALEAAAAVEELARRLAEVQQLRSQIAAP